MSLPEETNNELIYFRESSVTAPSSFKCFGCEHRNSSEMNNEYINSDESFATTHTLFKNAVSPHLDSFRCETKYYHQAKGNTFFFSVGNFFCSNDSIYFYSIERKLFRVKVHGTYFWIWKEALESGNSSKSPNFVFKWSILHRGSWHNPFQAHRRWYGWKAHQQSS